MVRGKIIGRVECMPGAMQLELRVWFTDGSALVIGPRLVIAHLGADEAARLAPLGEEYDAYNGHGVRCVVCHSDDEICVETDVGTGYRIYVNAVGEELETSLVA